MKQGFATSSRSGTKPQPQAHRVSETYAGQIGSHFGTPGAAREMYEGRGLAAPKVSEECHPCGSQGKR